MIGLALAVQGQWAEAGQLLSQAVPALERSSEWREWCRVVGYVGISVVARGDYHRGAAEAQRALDRALELSDQAIIGSNHILLCVTHVLNERMEALAATARSRSRRPSGQASRSSSTPVSPSGVGPTEGSTTMRPPAATWNSPTPSVLVWVGSSSPIGSPSPAPTPPWPRGIDEALTLAQQAVGITFRPPTRSSSRDDYVAIARTPRRRSATPRKQPTSSPRRNSTTSYTRRARSSPR